MFFGAELQSVYHRALIFRMAIVLLIVKYISFVPANPWKKLNLTHNCALGKFSN